ncbi:MAG: glycosyltransferase family 4 protein [Anaerolineae bacterium]
MKILMISWEYPPYIEGGMGRHVAELAPALAQQGVDLHVVTPVGADSIEHLINQANRWPTQLKAANTIVPATISTEDGVVVHRVLSPKHLTNENVFERANRVNEVLTAYLAELQPTLGAFRLVHTHDWLTYDAAIAAATIWNCPLVVTVHATELGRARGHLVDDLQRAIDGAERKLVSRATFVIVCSQHMAYELQHFFAVPNQKMAVVPNGVNLTELQQVPTNGLTEFRAKYAAPTEQIVFSIARLVYEKGIHRLLDAAPRILEKCPNTRFIIAGRGPQAETLQQQANSFGITDRVDLIGFITDEERNRLFKVADCAVFPSLYEPFGIVALEAMSLGCPVVVSDVGGLAEVVTHRETGITVYPDDPESVAWGVTQALTRPDWNAQHVAEALKWVSDNFNWERIAGLTTRVYRRVVAAG